MGNAMSGRAMTDPETKGCVTIDPVMNGPVMIAPAMTDLAKIVRVTTAQEMIGRETSGLATMIDLVTSVLCVRSAPRVTSVPASSAIATSVQNGRFRETL